MNSVFVSRSRAIGGGLTGLFKLNQIDFARLSFGRSSLHNYYIGQTSSGLSIADDSIYFCRRQSSWLALLDFKDETNCPKNEIFTDGRIGRKGNKMSSVTSTVKDAGSKKTFSQKTLVREQTPANDEAIVEGAVAGDVATLEPEAAHAGSLVDFVAPISETGHHDDHVFDDENSLSKRIAILGTVLLPLAGLTGAIYLAFQYGMVSWLDVFMLIGGWYLTGMGITIGFHRMLTHRSFEAHPAVRWFWTAAGSLAVEGSPIDWCMVHRKHHRFSDHHGDPHSPHLHDGGLWESLVGFWHSHTGWLFNANWSKQERKKYVPDLLGDPLLESIDRNYVWWVVATLVAPAIIGGFAGLMGFGSTLVWGATPYTAMAFVKGAILGFVWGGLARVCLSHHMTWAINSICHIFGSQDYKSSDDSRNNFFFGVFSHGEGWHNNHHAFPTSARHGLEWWQFDLSWVIIRGLEKCGLVWNVKLPTQRQLETRSLKEN